MKNAGAVYSMGPLLDEYTLNCINNAKQITENEQNKKRNAVDNKFVNKKGVMVDSTLDKMNEIKSILKKAGVSIRYFPFTPVKNKQGEIEGFVPKGENIKEIKEDIDRYKEKIEEAFKKGKITPDEHEKLQQNLDELVQENDIDLEEAENIEVTDAEVNDYLNAVIYRNFGNNYDLDGIKEKYEESDLEGKQAFLSKFNSEINKKLGIAGKLEFVNDNNPLNFEDSFSKDGKGYMLSNGDIDVSADNLKNVLYGMVERSLIRKHELEKGQQMSPDKKKAIHDKIMRDKEKREQERQRQQDKYNQTQARKKIRMMENSKSGF